MWDAETNWAKGGQDHHLGFETSHFLDGFAWPDKKFRFKPDWAAYGPRGKEMPTLPDHFDVIDNATADKPFRMLVTTLESDPFLGRPAMHTGLDFRSSTGDPVRATATGEVVTASWQGGYGNMVEIDHGNGLSTRFGHMSKIEVKVVGASASAIAAVEKAGGKVDLPAKPAPEAA